MFGMRAAALLCLVCLVQTPAAPQAPPLGALAKMPVREITVFKDGHAFVLHEGRLPADASGEVRMDYLPTPVLGTFWPYSADKNVKLRAVTAGRRRVLVPRTALTLRELLEANPGAPVGIEEISGPGYGAQIVGVPTRTASELEATSPPGSGDRLPEKANLVLLKTVTGTTAVPFERIQKVTFTERFQPTLGNEEFRNLLTLKLDWPGGKVGKTADVGMLYLQRGVRWIPGYKVTIDGKGSALVQLQATLLNELTDLENVSAHLVIGVPSFDFRDTPDPIGLQETLAQLSSYFGRDARTSNAFSNAVMSQTARMGEYADAEPARSLGPEVAGANRSEDLFVFTVRGVTLRKGERMVLPVAEYRLAYKDVYTLELPFAPPRELTESYNTEQQAQWARLLAAPRVLHKIRLRNAGGQPLTTAPALLLGGERVLGQGTMTYTPPGAEADLTLTAAVDVSVKKTERETGRTADAVEMGGYKYARVDLAGTIRLTNNKKEAVRLEVNRYVLGSVDSADNNGVVARINLLEDPEALGDAAASLRSGWPSWWSQVNGVGRITWKLDLPPGKSIDLNYAWHYFWR